MFHLEKNAIIGLPQHKAWAEVVSVARTSECQTFGVLGLQGEAARSLGATFKHELESLSFTQASEVYAWFHSASIEAAQAECFFSMAVLFVAKEDVIAFTYNGSVLLKRQRRVAPLVQSLKNTLEVRAGKWQDEDVYTCLTLDALSFSQEITLKLQQGYEHSGIISSLASSFQSGSVGASAAYASVLIKETAEVSQSNQYAAREQSSVGSQFSAQHQESLKVESKIPITETRRVQPQVQQPPLTQASAVIQAEEVTRPAEPAIYVSIETLDDEKTLGEQDIAYSSDDTTDADHRKQTVVEWLTWWREYRGQKLASITAFFKSASRPEPGFGKRILKSTKTFFGQCVSALKRVGLWLYSIFVRKPGAIYVESQTDPRLKKVALAIVGVISMAGSGVAGWSWYQKNQLNPIQEDISSIQSELQKAQSLVESDPINARVLVNQLQQRVTMLAEEHKNNSTRLNALTQLQQKISELDTALNNHTQLQGLPLVADVRGVVSDFVISSIALQGDTIIALDGEKKRAVAVNSSDGFIQNPWDWSNQVSTQKVASDGTQSVLLSDGISLIDTANGALTSVRTPGESNKAATQIGMYLKYVYVLNPEKRAIYRYAPRDGAYSDPIGWLQSAPGFDFTVVNDWTINGKIWITTTNGKLYSFTSGRGGEVDLSIPTGNPEKQLLVASVPDVDTVVLIEPAQHRIIQLNDEGVFVKELRSIDLAAATDAVLSSDGKMVYIASGSRILKVEL